MSRQAAPQPGLVKREEKDDKLSQLVLRYLDSLTETGPHAPAATNCLLIARSAESPVARTVLTLGAAARLESFSVRAIFAFLGTAETVQIAEACRASDWALQVRWARDLRLLEAHEQLVIGPATSWIGDSMRRDPLSRDACELYAPDCQQTAQRAIVFFERLWQVSEPVLERHWPPMDGHADPVLVPGVGSLTAKSGSKCRPGTSA